MQEERCCDDFAEADPAIAVASLRRDDRNRERLTDLPALEKITAIDPSDEQLRCISQLPGLRRLRLARRNRLDPKLLLGLRAFEELVLVRTTTQIASGRGPSGMTARRRSASAPGPTKVSRRPAAPCKAAGADRSASVARYLDEVLFRGATRLRLPMALVDLAIAAGRMATGSSHEFNGFVAALGGATIEDRIAGGVAQGGLRITPTGN